MEFLIDIDSLKEKFPFLKVENDTINGSIDFCCFYDKEEDRLEYNSSHQKAVEDLYKIQINCKKKDTWGLPKVYEIGGKIERYAKEKNIELDKLHINQDKSCCLGIFPKLEWEGVSDFIIKQVIPFLYWHSHLYYYEEKPWGEYAHGNQGIIEAMTLPNAKGVDRNILCPCNSGRKYKKCCMIKDDNLKSKKINFINNT